MAIMCEDKGMEFFTSIKSLLRNRLHQLTAYMATLYYLEIISLMFGLLFLYGKAVSIIVGTVLSLLLAYHIIQLYLKNELHRKIQLFIIDIHAPFAIGYLFYNIAHGIEVDMLALFIIFVRAFLLTCEIPLFWYLTGKDAFEIFQ
jgi:hypothetical protein